MNIAQLEQALRERRVELQKLYNQRSQSEQKLREIDKRIAKLEGAGAGGGRRGAGGGGGGGTRVRNEKPLPDVIEVVLRGSGKPLKVADIVEGVKGEGYKSNSANFRAVVNQMLIKDDRFTQADRGVYQLKK